MENNYNLKVNQNSDLAPMTNETFKLNKSFRGLLSIFNLVAVIVVALMTFSCQSSKSNKAEDSDSTQEEAVVEEVDADAEESVLEKITNEINGHEFVDLGLPSGVKWATCNIGASSPSENGRYFAWGETSTKSEYISESCETEEKEMNDFSGNSAYDAATANWGDPWRMPTKSEMYEIVNNCKWEMAVLDGCKGMRVTGPNGNSIFLPAAGACYGRSVGDVGNYCKYWTSSPDRGDILHSTILFTFSDEIAVYVERRMLGLPVRAVAK